MIMCLCVWCNIMQCEKLGFGCWVLKMKIKTLVYTMQWPIFFFWRFPGRGDKSEFITKIIHTLQP